MGSNFRHFFGQSLRGNGNNDGNSLPRTTFVHEDVNRLRAFYLQDARIGTPPSLSTNPLLELLLGENKSQFQINKLQDHLARIEMKVQRLESEVPIKLQRKFVVASAEMDPNEGEEEPGESADVKKDKNKRDKKGIECSKRKNCIAQLLFSKCWAGSKDKKKKIGWNVQCCNKLKKGRCSPFTKCPCGKDAPCKKIEKKPCPASQSSDGKGGKGQGHGKHGKGDNKEGSGLSALCGKVAPCLFGQKKGHHDEKKSSGQSKVCSLCFRIRHKHTPCCCRCKDNPALSRKNNKSEAANKGKKSSEDEFEDAEDGGNTYLALGAPEIANTVPIPCAGCTDCDEIRGTAQITGKKADNVTQTKIVPKERAANVVNPTKQGTENSPTTRERTGNVLACTRVPSTEVCPKREMSIIHDSSTSLPLLTPPPFTNEFDKDLVSHTIHKTISTIHGPMRLEQEIVINRRQHPSVVVTHGEKCECNLCKTLKNECVTNKSPRIVCFQTDKGPCALVNHADDCQCTLCSTLEQGLTVDTPVKDLKSSSSCDIKAFWSPANVKESDEIGEPEWKDFNSNTIELSSDKECSSCGGMNIANKEITRPRITKKIRKKKCHCFQCLRRKVRRLKRNLKDAIESRKNLQQLQGFPQHSFRGTSESHNINENDDNSDNDSDACNKRVSFTKKPNTVFNDSEDQVSVVTTRCMDEVGQHDRRKQSWRKREVHSDHNIVIAHESDESAQSIIKRVEPRKIRQLDERCHCLVCNSSRPISREGNSKATILSTMSSDQQQVDDGQRSPPERPAQKSCGCNIKADHKGDMLSRVLADEITFPDTEFIRPAVRCEPGCTGRCRNLTPQDELRRMGVLPSTFVLNASPERSPKILYWEPSDPNLAAAFRSDSYYIPDLDEFPTTDQTKMELNSDRNPTSLKREPEDPLLYKKNRVKKNTK